MKYTYTLLSIIAMLCWTFSCANDDEMTVNYGLGLLKKVEYSATENGSNDNDVYATVEFLYGENEKIKTITLSQQSFFSAIYDVDYVDDEIKTLTITQNYLNQGTMRVDVYDVNYQGNQIILTNADAVDEYILTVSDGYLDNYKAYYGPNNEYYQEAVFLRDANNNIDSISYYETNQSDTDLLVYQYAYSDFDGDVDLDSAFNPVFNYAFSLYDPLLGLALNLEISNQAPLKSSYWDGNGTYREENISVEILLVEEDNLKELSYTDQGAPPENNYFLKFLYE